jgi:hypothetical protein
MAIASIPNSFIQADISKKIIAWLLLFILPWEKSLRCFWELEKFIYGKKRYGKMRTIETTLEHIAHEVADEYRLSVT